MVQPVWIRAPGTQIEEDADLDKGARIEGSALRVAMTETPIEGSCVLTWEVVHS